MITLKIKKEFQDRYTAEYYPQNKNITVDNDRGIELLNNPRINVKLLEITNG